MSFYFLISSFSSRMFRYCTSVNEATVPLISGCNWITDLTCVQLLGHSSEIDPVKRCLQLGC